MAHHQRYAGLIQTVHPRFAPSAALLRRHHQHSPAQLASAAAAAVQPGLARSLRARTVCPKRSLCSIQAPTHPGPLLLQTLSRAARTSTPAAAAAAAARTFHSQPEQREIDDVVSFYDDKLTQYASQEIKTVTLKTLLGLGRSGSSASDSADGKKPPSTREDLDINLDVARYARKELPVRLARLIKATQKLPFIVGTNPYIKRVYKLYYDSFQSITSTPEDIRDKSDLDRFAAMLQGLVETHADVIPMLSQGFLECKRYMGKEDIKTFLDDMIRARIGIRLIAEQVISLREQRDHDSDDHDASSTSSSSAAAAASSPRSNSVPGRLDDDVVGVVHTELRPAELIRTCASFVQELCDVNYGSSPEVVINGQTDATFTYVPVHLEYILCELLKNAVRATVEHSQKMGRSALNPYGNQPDGRSANASQDPWGRSGGHHGHNSSSGPVVISSQASDDELDPEQDPARQPNEFGHPPVEVTIAQGDHEITIRIRDQGGGISREDLEAIFDYSFTTVKSENDSSESMDAGAGDSPYGVDSIFKGVSRLAMQAGLGGPIAGLGFGLPLTKIYAQYFGGNMHLVSLQGYGCDVFLKLKQIDETLEDLQI